MEWLKDIAMDWAKNVAIILSIILWGIHDYRQTIIKRKIERLEECIDKIVLNHIGERPLSKVITFEELVKKTNLTLTEDVISDSIERLKIRGKILERNGGYYTIF